MFNILFYAMLLTITSHNLKCNGCQISDQTYRMKRQSDSRVTTNNLCSVPNIQNGEYDFPTGNVQYTPGDPPPNFPVIVFCTNEKYVLNTTYAVVYCVNGKFEKDLPKCVLACPARNSTSVDVQCELNGVERDCSKQVPEGTIATMKCKPNFVELNPGPSYATCLGGSWSKPQKQCIRTCPALISTYSVDVQCELNGVKGNCSKEVPEGTVATMKCKPHFVELNNNSSIAKCLDGSWDIPRKECVTDCGKPFFNGTSIANGKEAKRGSFPWHVAIYRQHKELVKYVCGGSIISERFVLSIDQCFNAPVSEYFVAAGKLYSNWDAPEDADFVQKRKISKLHVPSVESKHGGHIVVVVVKEPFVLTNFIKPICVDWNSKYVDQQLKEGEIGEVADWNYEKPDIPEKNSSLIKLTFPYHELRQCLQKVPDYLKNYFTVNKYCATYANGTNPCYISPGTGMVFLHTDEQFEKNKYYIQGIASFSFGDVNYCRIILNTKVADCIPFIRNVTSLN